MPKFKTHGRIQPLKTRLHQQRGLSSKLRILEIFFPIATYVKEKGNLEVLV